MDSPYIRKNTKRKNTQSNTSITKTQTHTRSDNTKNFEETKRI